jgi:Flp pilus assembly protein TadB
MEAVSSTTCPHGLPPGTCQICRVLEPTPVRAGRPERRRSGVPGNLVTVAIVAVVGFVVFGWVVAAFFAVLHILELVAVAAGAGWVGWKLGVRRGRRG